MVADRVGIDSCSLPPLRKTRKMRGFSSLTSIMASVIYHSIGSLRLDWGVAKLVQGAWL